MLSRLYAWLDSRLKLEPVKETLLDEPIPGGASWIYVFGSATLFVFFLQAITGMFLAVYYAPTPDHAYDSIRYIETQVLFGPFVRGLHHWGASAMVVAIGLHMLQVFLYGAYKPPRELMWMVGVLLLLLTMGFAFTGAVVLLGVFLVIVMLALLVPFPLTDKANPSDHSFIPVPEWYFLFYYQFLKYMEGPVLGPIAMWVLPGAFIALLLALPFLDPHHEREPASRPLVIGVGTVFLVGVFVLIGLSVRDLQAMKRTDPAVVSGRALYERFGCMGCHRIHGAGGAVGPDLSYVGDQRDRDWLIKHFRDPQSTSPGSIMPKFPLNEQELNDLTAYMLSLKKRV